MGSNVKFGKSNTASNNFGKKPKKRRKAVRKGHSLGLGKGKFSPTHKLTSR
jgi:hypothetical protein